MNRLVQHALSGGNATRWAPSYEASAEVVKALQAGLEDPNTSPPETVIQQMTDSLALTRNARALVQGKSIQPRHLFETEARSFFRQVAREGSQVLGTLQKLGLPPEAIRLYKVWTAKTAPLLQLMGFNDAIPHAAQVARLAAIRSAQRKESPLTVLASALVGWIHDPKLPDVFENLATHPVVAGSLVQRALGEDPELKGALSDAVNVLEGSQGAGAESVIEALADAAAINNDSRWINQHVIFNGLAKKGLVMDGIQETFWQRFEAMATGQPPRQFTEPQEADLGKVSFDTGLYLFDRNALNAALGVNGPQADLSSLLVSDAPDTAQLSEIGQKLKAANAIEALQVPALSVLGNSEDLSQPLAKAVAHNLAEADNTLLSPHKIVLTAREGTVLARIASFLKSFEDNVLALPVSFRQQAMQWQADLSRAILKASERLTQRPVTPSFSLEEPLGEQIQKLKALILNPTTWQKPLATSEVLDYGQLEDKPELGAQREQVRQQIEDVANALQASYEEGLQSSPNMFRLG